jgi:hypothetical protein
MKDEDKVDSVSRVSHLVVDATADNLGSEKSGRGGAGSSTSPMVRGETYGPLLRVYGIRGTPAAADTRPAEL